MNFKSLLLGFAAPVVALPLFAADQTADTSTAPQKWESRPFSLLPRSFQKDPYLDISVITEMSKAGEALPTPSAANPTYVVVLDSGEKDGGDVVAGERAPHPKALHDAVLQAMKTNGYRLADEAHPPTQLVDIVWGSFNKLTLTGGGDDLELQNLAQRAALVGGTRFSAEMMKAYLQGHPMFRMFKMQGHNDWLANLAEGNLYFIIATAYDYAAATKDQKVVLWRTKMSTDSNGVSMDDSVPTLVANSGAYFGKESPPVRLDRPAVKDGQVEIGIPTVKNDENPSAAPAPQVPAEKH